MTGPAKEEQTIEAVDSMLDGFCVLCAANFLVLSWCTFPRRLTILTFAQTPTSTPPHSY